MRKYIMLAIVLGLAFVAGILTIAWVSATSTKSQASPNIKALTKVLKPALNISPVEDHELRLPDPSVVGAMLLDIAGDKVGNTFLLSNDPSVAKGTGNRIHRFAPDGNLIGSVPMNPEIWEPLVLVNDLATGSEGRLYAAVEWPIKRGGLLL